MAERGLAFGVAAVTNLVLSPPEPNGTTPACVASLDKLNLQEFADSVEPAAAWSTLLVLAQQLKLARALLVLLQRQQQGSLDSQSAISCMASVCREVLGPLSAAGAPPSPKSAAAAAAAAAAAGPAEAQRGHGRSAR